MVASRSLIGKACTDWYPSSIARGAKVGQRFAAWSRSAFTTGCPVEKHSKHGPSEFCSWKSSRFSPLGFEAAMNCSRPR